MIFLAEFENIRLSLTEAGLARGYLRDSWGVPSPRLAVYNDHSARVELATGGQGLRGYRSVVLLWDRLDVFKMRIISELALAGVTAGEMWVTFDRSWNGAGSLGDWVDGKGIPVFQDPQPTEGTRNLLYNSIQLTINALTIENDPAS